MSALTLRERPRHTALLTEKRCSVRTFPIWVVTAAYFTACEGVISRFDNSEDASGGDSLTCSSTPSANGLEAALETFSTTVFPAMETGETQCVSCHAPSSGRAFVMAATASETFYRARGAGFFQNQPGSLLARVTHSDANVRMPSDAPAWPASLSSALARVACLVQSAQIETSSAADEIFPAELLSPYLGREVRSYDNPFINHHQLKAKVKAIFNDSWVRNGVDGFEANIGLFGGVNFTTHSIEARAATPEFLLGMDALAPAVCEAAAAQQSGPFSGLSPPSTPLIDVPEARTTAVEFETLTPSPATGVGQLVTNPSGYSCYTNCTFSVPYVVPAPGLYRVTVRARPTVDGNGVGPSLRVQIGSTAALTTLDFNSPAAFETKTAEVTATSSGASVVTVNFFNDATVAGGDRNITLDTFTITGPIGGSTGTSRADATKAKISSLYSRILFRPATAQEQTQTHALLTDVVSIGGPLTEAWSSVCEMLMRHPDFLFTKPPAMETMTAGPARDAMRLVALTQRALGRPPSEAEFSKLAAEGYGAATDAVFESPDFRDYYLTRMRLRLESRGTLESDEPARLWT
jgi:hypothetical protein